MERHMDTLIGAGQQDDTILSHCCAVLTFIYVRRQTANKHLTGEALDALPILVGVTVGGAEDSWDTLVAVPIIEEIVVNGEEGGAACSAEKRQLSLEHASGIHTHAEAHQQKHNGATHIVSALPIVVVVKQSISLK